MRKWENVDFSKYLILAKWFVEILQNTYHHIPSYLNNYLEQYDDKLKSKKEEIFFNSCEELYHLNMLCVEIMGRISRPDYESRKRKAIVLPAGMKINQKRVKKSI